MTKIHMSRVFVLLISFLIVGCGEKTIDGSSDESLEDSIKKIREDLSKEEKEKFKAAVTAVALKNINLVDPEGSKKKIVKELDGKTALDVIELGEKIAAEIEEKQAKFEEERLLREKEEVARRKERQVQYEKELLEHRKQEIAAQKKRIKEKIIKTVDEIKELKKQYEIVKKARSEISKFKIIKSEFYYAESSYITKPIIDLKIKNETKYPISRVYFSAVLSSPGRSIPWVKDTFNYKVPGGVEPGEIAEWSLAPNMFGEWSKAPRDRDDMILTVEVTRLDGSDEETLFDSEFSEYDKNRVFSARERLDSLKESLKKLNEEQQDKGSKND